MTQARISASRTAQISFFVLLAAALALLATVVLPLWKPILIATVLAAVLGPPNQWLTRKLRGRRKVAAVLTTIFLVVVVLLPISVVTVIGVGEAISAIEFVRSALARGGINELLHALPRGIEEPIRQLMTMAPAGLSGQVGGQVAGILSRAVAAMANISFALVMMLIAFYALLLNGARLMEWLRDVSPLPETGELANEARRVSVHVFRSTFLTALAQGTLATVGYVIASVPNPVFFGVITFFAAFIPSVGTTLIALPVIALLALSGLTWQPLFLLAWFSVLVGLIDNLLNPLLIRGGMHLDGVVVFFSLIGGLAVFGGIGILVGPLAITFFLAMIRFGYRDYLARGEIVTATE